MKNLIPYALKDGQMVNVEDVERGRACGCVCPGCHEPLVAKKGKVMAHHFAHTSNSECSSHGESVVHWLAKHWFAERAAVEGFSDFRYQGRRIFDWDGLIEFRSQTPLALSDIEVEKKRDKFTPDVKGVYNETEVWLEIAVSHKCSEEKVAHCKAAGILLFEVDVSVADFHYDDFGDYLSALPFRALSWHNGDVEDTYNEKANQAAFDFWEKTVNAVVSELRFKSIKHVGDRDEIERRLTLESSANKFSRLIPNIKDLQGGYCPWVYESTLRTTLKWHSSKMDLLDGWNGSIGNGTVRGIQSNYLFNKAGRVIFGDFDWHTRMDPEINAEWIEDDQIRSVFKCRGFFKAKGGFRSDRYMMGSQIGGADFFVSREVLILLSCAVGAATRAAKIEGMRRVSGCLSCKYNQGAIDLPCGGNYTAEGNWEASAWLPPTIGISCSYTPKTRQNKFAYVT